MSRLLPVTIVLYACGSTGVVGGPSDAASADTASSDAPVAAGDSSASDGPLAAGDHEASTDAGPGSCTTGTACGPGKVCVSYFCGPPPCNGAPTRCVPDPCEKGALSCDCAEVALCAGYAFCTVVEADAGFVSCWNGG